MPSILQKLGLQLSAPIVVRAAPPSASSHFTYTANAPAKIYSSKPDSNHTHDDLRLSNHDDCDAQYQSRMISSADAEDAEYDKYYSSPFVKLLVDTLQDDQRVNDIQELQARVLDALNRSCTNNNNHDLDPGVATRCVEIILSNLNAYIQYSCSTATRAESQPASIIKQTEKALLLLHLLLTLRSEAGCAAARLQSSSLIKTLGKTLLRVSEASTASAIAILIPLCSCRSTSTSATSCERPDSPNDSFLNAVSQSAIPSKLVLVLQVASHASTKLKAGKLLQLLAQDFEEH